MYSFVIFLYLHLPTSSNLLDLIFFFNSAWFGLRICCTLNFEFCQKYNWKHSVVIVMFISAGNVALIGN